MLGLGELIITIILFLIIFLAFDELQIWLADKYSRYQRRKNEQGARVKKILARNRVKK
jgi:hypothetical protein